MQATTTSVPTNIGRILGVVRRLVDFGRNLADTLRQRNTAPEGAHLTYGTGNLARILDLITRGLRRAAALESLLLARAARGRDVTPPPMRAPACRSVGDRTPRAPRPDVIDVPLPSVEQIAAEIRRRPIGAVVVDICRDIGILPGHLDREFWEELRSVVLDYDGSLIRLLGMDRQLRILKACAANPDVGWPPPEYVLQQALNRPPRGPPA